MTTLEALGYLHVQEAKHSVLAGLGSFSPPQIGIILGSGLGQLEEKIAERKCLDYADIAHMPTPSVKGHGGRLLLGKLGNKDVACLSGRVHLYEGHPIDRVVFGVRLLWALGANTLIVTNASGGIGAGCGPGQFMLIRDHINFTGQNPLVGENDERFGTRFPDMSHTYDPALGEVARKAAQSLQIPLLEGVYAGVLGPSYETPAEIAMLAALGASAVGMSTVAEVIAARHLGLKILGISCITNYAAGRAAGELRHEDVAQEAKKNSLRFCELVETLCSQIP